MVHGRSACVESQDDEFRQLPGTRRLTSFAGEVAEDKHRPTQCIRAFTTRSTMKLDPAVIKRLNLDAASTTVSSAGGGGCSSASTSKIVSQLENGQTKAYFMETGSGREAEIMFEGIRTLVVCCK